MSVLVEALWEMPEVELLAAYDAARREFVEKKFARDSQRARLDWLRAKVFLGSAGGVSERRNAVDASEELGRKGQELREMTRDLELCKADVDLIAIILRMRFASASSAVKAEAPPDDEQQEGG